MMVRPDNFKSAPSVFIMVLFRLSYAPVMAMERLFLKSHWLLNERDIILSIRRFIAFKRSLLGVSEVYYEGGICSFC